MSLFQPSHGLVEFAEGGEHECHSVMLYVASSLWTLQFGEVPACLLPFVRTWRQSVGQRRRSRCWRRAL